MQHLNSLYLRSFIFTILQPGIVVGFAPYYFYIKNVEIFPKIGWIQILALMIFLIGFSIITHCIVKFIQDGGGTISPANRTQELVVQGLYKYSRNPMYVGVMLMLIAEVIFFWSKDLLVYTTATFVALNLFIYYIEEPRLKRDFGSDYQQYLKRVGRWI